MIFGDEPRECASKKKKIYGLVPQTDSHVGPGSYFAESRSTSSFNTKKSHNVKQPMGQGSSSKTADRSFMISTGVMTPLGVALPGVAQGETSPGPGHYAGLTSPDFSASKSLSQSQKGSPEQNRTSYMGSSPRICKSNSLIRNGVVFEGASSNQKNSPFGPGHYFVEQDTLNKKSFNARVAGANTHASGGVSSISTSPMAKSPRRTPSSSSARKSYSNVNGQSGINRLASNAMEGSEVDNSYLYRNSNAYDQLNGQTTPKGNTSSGSPVPADSASRASYASNSPKRSNDHVFHRILNSQASQQGAKVMNEPLTVDQLTSVQ